MITRSTVYETLIALVTHSEETRWNRLNTFLVLATLFVGAWVALFAGTKDFDGKPLLLFAFCLPGIIFGVLWPTLQWRSSQYLDDFHDKAYKMEDDFPSDMPKPLHMSEERRSKAKSDKLERCTTSKWLVTAIPCVVLALFIFLAGFSLTRAL